MKAGLKNICLLRLSAIGDVCHALAMVERIRQQWPDTQLTWVIGKVEYQLLKGLPGVRFILFDKSAGKQAYTQLKQDLQGEEFDALLIMQLAFRANRASRMIKAKIRLGYDWGRSKELHWLFANRRIQAQKHAHVLDSFMAFADALGVPEQSQVSWPDLTTDKDKSWAREQAAELGPFVVISPAASKAERNWLPKRYGALAEHMTRRGFNVVLCGGPGQLDRQTSDAILQHTSSIKRNYVGETSLTQLLALLAEAQLVVAPDTGPAHMATTTGTSVMGLYAHSNPLRTGPYCDQEQVVSVYDQCILEQYGQSWEELKWGIRAKGKNLMEKITLDQVIQQFERWLSSNKDH